MKRIEGLLLAAIGTVLLVSCKSTANSYKQAYEKAVQQDVAQPETLNKIPETEEIIADATVQGEVASIPVREEKVSVVTGDNALKMYAVICGSFSLKTNADGLRQRLIGDGYPAVVVLNEAGKTYRVAFNSFDTKEEAVAARRDFMNRYPDNRDFQAAWILYKK